MKILVAICTFNRAESLARTLESLCDSQSLSLGSLKVLVVNNRCTDHTDEVIARFSGRLPIAGLHQPIQGLSHARNAVIDSTEAAEADYILWTDDDVWIERHWLRAYETAFLRFPEASLFGGNVVPLFEVAPPQWLVDSWDTFKNAFSARQFDETFPIRANESRLPYGANFAIKAGVQRTLRYDTRLGVVGNTWMGGEETAVMRRAIEHGQTGWWVPEASVRHFIPARRMSMIFIGSYFRGQGRTSMICSGELPLPWYRKPLWLWRRVFEESSAYIYQRARGDVARWSVHYRSANFFAGKLFG